jgi:hypothetical protein
MVEEGAKKKTVSLGYQVILIVTFGGGYWFTNPKILELSFPISETWSGGNISGTTLSVTRTWHDIDYLHTNSCLVSFSIKHR